MPMFIQGLAGMIRRMSDGGAHYAHNAGRCCSWNLMHRPSRRVGPRASPRFLHHQFLLEHQGRQEGRPTIRGTPPRSSGRRPRRRRTAISQTEPIVYRGPYEYSVPGAAKDFTPQNEPEPSLDSKSSWTFHTQSKPGPIPASTTPSSASGCSSRRKSCCSARCSPSYILLRVGAAGMAARLAERPARHDQHDHPDQLVGDDGHGVGVAEDERLRAEHGCT